ncbi:MAG: preprotein translocase subunit SecG [Gammaproteobacteria bacterium]|nr:preprotein translocase subunit SecG [Gammaproteobacteria bacterium]OUU12365.1 MAG: preprotein translocase subunit SecG [Gammaproteobacteria bacterium TMED34]
MQYIETFVLITHVVAAIAIIALVLYQRGRGAEMGTGFGAGASGTVFGSAGSGNFMTRMTTTVAITFFVTSFGLAYFAKLHADDARQVGIPQIESMVPVPAEEGEVPSIEVPVADNEVPSLALPAGSGSDEN